MARSFPASIDSDQCLSEGFFARHETFCPRYGWIKKGFDGVCEDPRIFDRPDAIERLGVGKNMVRSIRFWSMAFQVIESIDKQGPRKLSGEMQPTELGRALLSENGWDPYIEDPASLWLLHWKLFVPPLTATAWSMAFNLGYIGNFTLINFTEMLIERKNRYPSLARFSTSSIEKDASCFVRMYAPLYNRFIEEMECPFTHLGVLIATDKRQTYRFNGGTKSTLPDLILLAACCDYANSVQPGLRTLSLNRIAYDFNSPGVVFRLSESDLETRLERSAHQLKGIQLVESYGQRQLHFDRSPIQLYWDTLTNYFCNG